jgi:hypothetical protein
MKLSKLSSTLRLIASKVDASKNPSRSMVIRDIRKIIAAVEKQTIYIYIYI